MRKKHLYLVKGNGKAKGKGREKEYSSKKKNRKKIIVSLIVVFALLLLTRPLISWAYGRVTSYFVSTYIVEENIFEQTFSGEGFIIRDEKIIPAPQKGYLLSGREQGTRVAVGQVIAELVEEIEEEEGEGSYGSESYSGEEKDLHLEEENNKDELEKEEFSSEKIEYRTSILVNRLRESMSQGNMEKAERYYDELLKLSQEVVFQSSFDVSKSKVVTPYSGIIVYQTDGLENLLYPDNISFLKKSHLKDLEPESRRINFGEKVSEGFPFIKIVDNHSWYFILPLTTDKAELLKDKRHIHLKLDFAPHRVVRAEVYKIKEDKGSFLVTFKITQHIDEFYLFRESGIEVIYNRSRGITIPASAIINKDGKTGVYAIHRARVRFRPVEIKEQIGDKYLVEELSPGKSIITNPGLFREGQYIYWKGNV